MEAGVNVASSGAPSGLLLLIVLSVLCTVLSLLLRRKFGAAPGLRIGLLSFVLIVAGGAAAAVPYVTRAASPTDHSVTFKLLVGGLLFCPALWITGSMLGHALSDAFETFLVHVDKERARSYDYGKARAKARGADIQGATREYHRYFDAKPTIPDPLFAAARLLTQCQRYREAENTLRQIAERFENDLPVWTEAAYLCANLLDTELADRPAANILYREVLHRAPKSDQARLAAERLQRNFAPPHSLE